MLSVYGSSALSKSIYPAFLSYQQVEEEGNLAVSGKNIEQETVEDEVQAEQDKKPQATQSAQPVFKIQILTSDRVLPAKSRLFKGLAPVSRYKEGGIYKYTYGESTDYNRILRLKRSKVDAKFKDAFIIAFKNGEKMNINQAIKEFKQNRKKRHEKGV